MPFVVPKFIETKAKIVGPLTFKQFLFVGGAGAICFLLYFLAPFYLFLLSCVVLIGGSLVLAFVKINGRPIPIMIKNFFEFLISSKIYLWKKSKTSPSLIKKKRAQKTEDKGEEAPVLDITEKSRIKNLSSKVEIGQR